MHEQYVCIGVLMSEHMCEPVHTMCTCMSWGCIRTRAVNVGVYTVWGSGSIFTLHVCEFTWEIVKGDD